MEIKSWLNACVVKIPLGFLLFIGSIYWWLDMNSNMWSMWKYKNFAKNILDEKHRLKLYTIFLTDILTKITNTNRLPDRFIIIIIIMIIIILIIIFIKKIVNILPLYKTWGEWEHHQPETLTPHNHTMKEIHTHIYIYKHSKFKTCNYRLLSSYICNSHAALHPSSLPQSPQFKFLEYMSTAELYKH